MKTLLVALLAAGALAGGATASSVGAAGTTHRLLGVVRHTAQARTTFDRATTTAATRKTAGFNCVSACSAYESSINQFFTDVATASGATDNVYSVLTQYYQQTPATPIAYATTFGGSYVDGNPYPASGCNDGRDTFCVTDSQIQNELKKAIAANHWTTASTDLFFIFTPANVGVCIYAGSASASNPCTTNVFCAYHKWTAENVLYAVEPDAAAIPGGACDNGLQTPVGNGADDTINTISHEQIEAITDPLGTAWASNDATAGFPEIGDLCAYDFGTPLGTAGTEYNQVINGDNYLLQLEYSNADGGCVPYLGGPVTAPDPRDGSGPLAYQSFSGSAPVMLTNTVHAIYWVPVAPANLAIPRIAGTAKLGKTLSTSHGRWTRSPTKYAYQWFRCSPAGTSCRAIWKATGSSRTLKKVDATHKLYVRVTATNAAGSSKAISALTKTVKP